MLGVASVQNLRFHVRLWDIIQLNQPPSTAPTWIPCFGTRQSRAVGTDEPQSDLLNVARSSPHGSAQAAGPFVLNCTSIHKAASHTASLGLFCHCCAFSYVFADHFRFARWPFSLVLCWITYFPFVFYFFICQPSSTSSWSLAPNCMALWSSS